LLRLRDLTAPPPTTAEAAAKVLPASRMLRRLSALFVGLGLSRLLSVGIFHSLPFASPFHQQVPLRYRKCYSNTARVLSVVLL